MSNFSLTCLAIKVFFLLKKFFFFKMTMKMETLIKFLVIPRKKKTYHEQGYMFILHYKLGIIPTFSFFLGNLKCIKTRQRKSRSHIYN